MKINLEFISIQKLIQKRKIAQGYIEIKNSNTFSLKQVHDTLNDIFLYKAETDRIDRAFASFLTSLFYYFIFSPFTFLS